MEPGIPLGEQSDHDRLGWEMDIISAPPSMTPLLSLSLLGNDTMVTSLRSQHMMIPKGQGYIDYH